MKKNILEEIKRMNTLMGIKGVDNVYHFDISNGLKKNKIDEEITTQQITNTESKNKEDDEFEFIEFGKFGKIPLVKGAVKNYVGTQDIGTLLGLKNNPKYKFDQNYGWYEEFEKPSWGTYTAFSPEGTVDKNYVVKRFLPTINAPDIQWLKKNKVPFGFTAKNGKKFSLLFKLVEPTVAVLPDKYPDRPDRGWILVTPGTQGTTGNYDYGSTYYEVGTMEPYNVLAPKVEGDLSTYDGDSRSQIDKVVQSKYFFVGQLAGYVALNIISDGLLMRFVPPSVLLNVARLRVAKVLVQTFVELTVNGSLALYYFSKSSGDDEYEKIGYVMLAFCALPFLQSLKGVRNTFLGAQFSDEAMIASIARKVSDVMRNTSPETFWNVTYQKMGPAEQDMWMAFKISLEKNGPEWAELMNAGMQKHEFWDKMRELYERRGLSETEIETIITQTKQRFPGVAAKVQDIAVVVNNMSTKGSTLKFVSHLGAVVAYSKLAEKLYDVFTGYKGEDPNKTKKHAQNFGKVINLINNDPIFPEFEKWTLKQAETDSRILQIYQEELKKVNSLELTQAMFVNGLLSDETYTFIRRASLKIAADKQFVNDIKIHEFRLKYLNDNLCWEKDVVKKFDQSFVENLKQNFVKNLNWVLTTNGNYCKEYTLNEPSCVPCWSKLNFVKDYNTIVYPKDLKQTSNNKPTIITNEPKSITTNSAILTANVTSDGGTKIFDRGFYYSSLDSTPTSGETNVFTQKISGETGDFEFNLTGLSANTIYYYQAYALNVNGEGLGTIKDFVTLKTELDNSQPDQNLTTTTTTTKSP